LACASANGSSSKLMAPFDGGRGPGSPGPKSGGDPNALCRLQDDVEIRDMRILRFAFRRTFDR
jgi:hypothetical protein